MLDCRLQIEHCVRNHSPFVHYLGQSFLNFNTEDVTWRACIGKKITKHGSVRPDWTNIIGSAHLEKKTMLITDPRHAWFVPWPFLIYFCCSVCFCPIIITQRICNSPEIKYLVNAVLHRKHWTQKNPDIEVIHFINIWHMNCMLTTCWQLTLCIITK